MTKYTNRNTRDGSTTELLASMSFGHVLDLTAGVKCLHNFLFDLHSSTAPKLLPYS